jgi:hypothetical protein
MASQELERDDLMAAVGARRELGDEAEREVLESFLDRVGTAIDARVEQRLAEHGHTPARPRQRERPAPSQNRVSVPLALGSMIVGIAATGAASGLDHGGALVAIVAWAVIALINLAYAANR